VPPVPPEPSDPLEPVPVPAPVVPLVPVVPPVPEVPPEPVVLPLLSGAEEPVGLVDVDVPTELEVFDSVLLTELVVGVVLVDASRLPDWEPLRSPGRGVSPMSPTLT